MKMVKSLLLGTAAGLLAVSGAQAADMVVKAKPVLYVKICSLYGDGFYYIPGTDTCIKIGGYYRIQAEYNVENSGIVVGSAGNAGVGGNSAFGRFTRDLTNDFNYTSRAVVSFDVRNQTEYGALRSYIRAGWTASTPATNGGTTASAYWDRAFIQFAGFTVGRAQSFFDLFTHGGQWNYLNSRMNGDTGASGATVWAYTVQFGNGISATASLEDPVFHRQPTVDVTCADFLLRGSNALQDNAFSSNGVPCGTPTLFGMRTPDLVINTRIDQAWGYAGISAVAHDVSGAYYNQTGTAAGLPNPCGAGAVGTIPAPVAAGAIGPNCVNNGHPADKFGYAIAVGGQLNLPGGDGVGMNVVWSEGATGYAVNAQNWQLYNGSNSVGYAWVTDAVFGNGPNTEVQLTKAWSINAGYQHIWGAAGTWGAKWRTSLYGGYAAIEYNTDAKFLINDRLPAGSPCKSTVATASTITAFRPLLGNSCSPDASWWQVGTRTQFNPHPLLDIGLDVFYTRLNTAYKGPVDWTANGSRPFCANGVNGIACSWDDQNVWSAIVRWQRNFYP